MDGISAVGLFIHDLFHLPSLSALWAVRVFSYSVQTYARVANSPQPETPFIMQLLLWRLSFKSTSPYSNVRILQKRCSAKLMFAYGMSEMLVPIFDNDPETNPYGSSGKPMRDKYQFKVSEDPLRCLLMAIYWTRTRWILHYSISYSHTLIYQLWFHQSYRKCVLFSSASKRGFCWLFFETSYFSRSLTMKVKR